MLTKLKAFLFFDVVIIILIIIIIVISIVIVNDIIIRESKWGIREEDCRLFQIKAVQPDN